MYKNISPVQTVSELQFVELHQPQAYFVPLNLDTLLHCKIYEKRYLDPINYLDSSFHVNALMDSELFSKKIPIISKILAIQSEFVAVLRFYYNQIQYLNYLLKKILDNEKINSIYLSGWNTNTSITISEENYFTSRIVESLYGEIVKQVEIVVKKTQAFVYDFDLKRNIKSQVIINSFGYNFNRLNQSCKRRSITTSAILFSSLKGRQLIGSWLRGFKYMECNTKSNPFSVEPTSLILEDKIREKLINERINEIMSHFLTQLNKCRLLDQFLGEKRPSFSASFSMRGIDGYLLEKSHEMNIPSIAIPHGTIAPAFDEKDKIYKKFIAEAVFSGICTHVALQSKIAQDALKSQLVRAEPVLTGNLIFSEMSQKKGKKILYAVTLKDFSNMQFYGVEMYYEFLENLVCLEKIQTTIGLPVQVQLHPSARKAKRKLQILFPLLNFSTKNLSNNLKSSLLTISFSSTVIEDSLYSNVPVILFDQWERYQHCHAEKNPSAENKAIYYVSDLKGMITAINSIKKSQNIAFSDYVIRGKSSENFDSLIKNYL